MQTTDLTATQLDILIEAVTNLRDDLTERGSQLWLTDIKAMLESLEDEAYFRAAVKEKAKEVRHHSIVY